MKTRAISLALAVLLLSVSAAFAEPSSWAVPGANSGAGNHDLGQVSDTEMAAMTGGAWWSGACTSAIHTVGAIVWLGGFVSNNQIQQSVGAFAQHLECV